MGHDNGVIYEKPPSYEFQTVSLTFDRDEKVHGAEEVKSETPVFIDDNKVNDIMVELYCGPGSIPGFDSGFDSSYVR